MGEVTAVEGITRQARFIMRTAVIAIFAALILAAPASAAELHSRPGSPHVLWLDMAGSADAPAWGTPEQQTAVWSAVAGYFAFADLNVTTGYTGPLDDGVAARLEIGGGAGKTLGGTSWIGSWYATYLPNVAEVYPDNLGDDSHNVAIAAAHEFGHMMGLYHQSVYDAAGNLTAEYNPGDAAHAPIMGEAYYAASAEWWVGPSSVGAGDIQDDRAVILSRLGAASVPEPAGVLVVAGGVVLIGRRRKGANQ